MNSSKKNILIVSSSFYPKNSPRSFRTTQLVKEFARQGHDVKLLTIKNDEYHIPFENDYGVKISDLGQPMLPKIDSSKGNWAFKLFKRVVSRGLYQLFEYPKIELMFKVKKALQKESGYDLLISIAVPHPIHWGVAKAWRGKNRIAKTWVADCGDPYMGQTLDSFNKMFYFKYFEKDFCRKADYITVPIEEAKKGYYPKFRKKIRVIPQGFNFDEVDIDHSCYVPYSVPTFAYAGGFIRGGRDPRDFLDYLVKLDRDFKFVIYTKSTSLIEPWVESSDGRIEVRDYIPREELLKILSKMNFLVNFENQSPLMMPSKLIDYHLAGRPILSVDGSEISHNVINKFLDGNYENRFVLNNINRFRIENVCRKFLELCNTVTSS